MIDVFIVHAGADAEYVLNDVIPSLIFSGENKKCHTNVLLCGSEDYKEKYDELRTELEKRQGTSDNFEVNYTSKNWMKIAKAYIKKARVVLVVVSENSSLPGKEDTIGYEVKYAEKMGKLILFHKTAENVKLPDYLMAKDIFTGRLRGKADEYSLEQIRKRIDDFDTGYYDIFQNEKYDDPACIKEDLSKIMDQYKMYQKTSEDLVARRQSVSSFYISVNSALVAVSGMVMGLVSYPNNAWVILAMAVVGIILDLSWIKILEAYGSLNAAKMKVIQLLERQLPVSLYDTEWQVMSDKMNKSRYVSFTDSEKRIPKIFMCVYGAMILTIVVVLALRLFGVA